MRMLYKCTLLLTLFQCCRIVQQTTRQDDVDREKSDLSAVELLSSYKAQLMMVEARLKEVSAAELCRLIIVSWRPFQEHSRFHELTLPSGYILSTLPR